MIKHSELDQLATKHGDRLAIASGGTREYTFSELNDVATRFARGIRDLGVERGDRVGLMMRNCAEYLIAMFGCSRAGAIVVPIDQRSSSADLERVRTDTVMRLVVLDTVAISRMERPLRDIVGDATIVVVGEEGGQLFDELIARSDGPADFEDVLDHEIQSILFTSGTTGAPRGVMRSYRANRASAEGGREAVPTAPGEGWIYTLPMHSVGVYAFALAPILSGGFVICTPTADADGILDLAQRYRAVMLHGVPTLWEKLIASGDSARLASVRHALWGGSPLSEGTVQRLRSWMSLPCLGCYGASEAPCMTYATPQTVALHGEECSGRPVGGMQVRIVDDERQLCADRTSGNVEVTGPFLMDGYWNDPDSTAAAFTEDGWYRTGDWGFLADGSLTVTDRVKDMIITGGANVYPAEVENVISSMDGVSAVAVVGVPDDYWGHRVWAFVIRTDPALSGDTIIAQCRHQLASYKVPRRVEFVESFPRSALDKVQKNVLVGWGVAALRAEQPD